MTLQLQVRVNRLSHKYDGESKCFKERDDYPFG